MALEAQVGGSHYKDMKIQVVEYCHANQIPFMEGCVIKYVSRWRNKNGIDDLKKARHFIDLIIELETK
jgi:UDP-3-O-acyl-N-acetylglucosamine deacetylase